MSGNAGNQKASSIKAQIAWAITLLAGILLILVLRFVGLEPELTREPFPGFEGQQTVLVHVCLDFMGRRNNLLHMEADELFFVQD